MIRGYRTEVPPDESQPVESSRGDFRLLIVTTSSSVSEPVRREIERRAAGRHTQTMVVVPALAGSRFEQAAGEVDEAIAHADEHREPAAEEAMDAGARLVTEPRIGDSDPILAIEDALREFSAQEILIVTRPAEEADWMEEDLFDRARERFRLPIAHFVVGSEEKEILQTDRAEAEEGGPDAEIQGRSENLPPFSAHDLAGIVVAIVGTIVLVVLASSCDDLSAEGGLTEGGLSGCAARILIAGVVGLANLAHIVALMLFQTVRYRGFWRNLLGGLSLYGTFAGIVASLLVHH